MGKGGSGNETVENRMLPVMMMIDNNIKVNMIIMIVSKYLNINTKYTT